jgi:hypothetical protein
MNNKRKAMFYLKYWNDRNIPVDQARLDGYLKTALEQYALVGQDSLDATISTTLIYNGDGVRSKQISRRDLFIYPDYRDGWYSWTFHGDYFFNYLLKNGLLPQLYKTGNDLQSLHLWVAKAFEWKPDISPEAYSKFITLEDSTLQHIISFVDQHPEGKAFDKSILYLVLSNRAFERGDTVNGLKFSGLLDLQNIRRAKDKYEYIEKNFFQNMMTRQAMNLAAAGKPEQAVRIAQTFEEDYEKAMVYLFTAGKLFRQHADPATFDYLDSAYVNINKLDYSKVPGTMDPRFHQIMLLSGIGSKSINAHAAEILRDIPEGRKFQGILFQAEGISYEGNYYRALTSLPSTLTESQDLVCRTLILIAASRAKERQTGDSSWKAFDDDIWWDTNYLNFYPN